MVSTYNVVRVLLNGSAWGPMRMSLPVTHRVHRMKRMRMWLSRWQYPVAYTIAHTARCFDILISSRKTFAKAFVALLYCKHSCSLNSGRYRPAGSLQEKATTVHHADQPMQVYKLC